MKALSFDYRETLMVFELGPDFNDITEQEAERIRAKFENTLGKDARLMIVPYGVKVKILRANAVYQREKIDNYEYEAIAANEEDLDKRIRHLHMLYDLVKGVI